MLKRGDPPAGRFADEELSRVRRGQQEIMPVVG